MKNILNTINHNNKYTFIVPAHYFMPCANDIDTYLSDTYSPLPAHLDNWALHSLSVFSGFIGNAATTVSLFFNGEFRLNGEINTDFQKGSITEEEFTEFLHKRTLYHRFKSTGKFYPDDYGEISTEESLYGNNPTTIPKEEIQCIKNHIRGYEIEKSEKYMYNYFKDPHTFEVSIAIPYKERSEILHEIWNKPCNIGYNKQLSSLLNFLSINDNVKIVLPMITNPINYRHIISQIEASYGLRFTNLINNRQLIIAPSYEYGSVLLCNIAKKALQFYSNEETGDVISMFKYNSHWDITAYLNPYSNASYQPGKPLDKYLENIMNSKHKEL